MDTTLADLLAELIGFDTTSRNSNLQLIEWVRRYLAGHGLASRLTHSDDGSKANLFCRIGGDDLPLIVLSGHSDVVPVDGQDWSYPPFQLTDGGDGRLYGRGSADMKGFIACVLARVPDFVALAKAGQLRQGIGIALSYDEEVGCLGVGRLIDDLVAQGVTVAGCLIGEPTSMRPVVAHKGIAHYRCRVRGRAAHSSLTPYGVNAIEYAARLITHIRKLADAEASFGHRQPLYDVPFTTMQTGVIRGGVAAISCRPTANSCSSAAGCRETIRSGWSRRWPTTRRACCWKCGRWRRRLISRSSAWYTARHSKPSRIRISAATFMDCALAPGGASPTLPRRGCSARQACRAWCWGRDR